MFPEISLFPNHRGQEGGFSFHTFLKIFGPEVAGKFNPFRVDPVFPKTPPSTQPTQVIPSKYAA